jgi:hypothetical protein
MRATLTAGSVLAAILIAACAREEHKAPASPHDVADSPPASSSSLGLPQYLVADPSSAHGAGIALPLSTPGVHGLIVDKRRVVVGQGEPRVALDVTPEALNGVARIPHRFGNGFLFWTENALYRADAFDGPLVPLVRVPDVIEQVSFAPRSVLVHTRNGERWGIGLPNGERAAISPLGVADVHALDDGRAVGISDHGAVFTSIDHGAHWTDATVRLKSAPTKLASIGGELWVFESTSGASRLEPDGQLSWFDELPADTTTELRPKDPRWRGGESPLRTAFRVGAALDDSTALVIESGDVVRVDLHTGELVSVVPGRLPPDAQCEAVPSPGDVLFACVSRNASATAFVVSHTLSAEAAAVEQTFAGGGQFYAGSDGGLVYSGPCQGVSPSAMGVPVACVRMPGGRWTEVDVSALAADGGSADIAVARWVPRVDGHVVAIVVEPTLGVFDARAGSFQPIAEEIRDLFGASSRRSGHPSPGLRVVRARRALSLDVVDTSWSFAGGNSLRAWPRHGGSVEISDDGKVTPSPYAFDLVSSGAFGLGRSSDGRLFQSTDHGMSWTEVATPPSGAEALDLVSCTSAGCDLGAFYRVGWAMRPPRVAAPKTPAAPVPLVRRVRGLELACRPQGAVTSRLLARSEDSPEDLGLGMSRLPVANERNEWSYIRSTIPRGIVSPLHEPSNDSGDAALSLRAMLSGFGTTHDSDVIVVAGPNKSPLALRRNLAYVAPFDPLGRVVRTSIAMSDVVAAGRLAGMTTDEILAEDVTESGVVVTLTSADPTAPSDIAIHNVDQGVLTLVRGERVRVAMRRSQNNANVISGVILGRVGAPEEAAFLEVDSGGMGHVFKLGTGGITDLFEVSPSGNEAYYPANPDALAIGPKGELAILRTPSGSDPASALDPAFLVAPGMPPTALAPWSELKLADDAACKAEPGGYRATLQVTAPWIRVTTPELRVEDSPMIARVRWTPRRVCLEGFEVRLPNVAVRMPQLGSTYDASISTWLVGKGSSFARVGVAEGAEWRQPLECNLVTTGP